MREDGYFREGGLEVVGDPAISPLGALEAEEADAGQKGGGAPEDEFGLVLRRSHGLLFDSFRASLYSWNTAACTADTLVSSARLASIASAYSLASLRSLSAGGVPSGIVMESCFRV